MSTAIYSRIGFWSGFWIGPLMILLGLIMIMNKDIDRFHENLLSVTIKNYHQMDENKYCVSASYINKNNYELECFLFDHSEYGHDFVNDELNELEEHYPINEIFVANIYGKNKCDIYLGKYDNTKGENLKRILEGMLFATSFIAGLYFIHANFISSEKNKMQKDFEKFMAFEDNCNDKFININKFNMD